MKRLFIIFILGLSTTLMAAQKYNPYSNTWESVPDSWVLRYNPYANRWSFQSHASQLRYNSYKNVWEWDSGYNP